MPLALTHGDLIDTSKFTEFIIADKLESFFNGDWKQEPWHYCWAPDGGRCHLDDAAAQRDAACHAELLSVATVDGIERPSINRWRTAEAANNKITLGLVAAECLQTG